MVEDWSYNDLKVQGKGRFINLFIKLMNRPQGGLKYWGLGELNL